MLFMIRLVSKGLGFQVKLIERLYKHASYNKNAYPKCIIIDFSLLLE